jgi:hypothetical protein
MTHLAFLCRAYQLAEQPRKAAALLEELDRYDPEFASKLRQVLRPQ